MGEKAHDRPLKPTPAPAVPGRVAGIDYGTVRIGIAISDPERKIASPLENYTRRGIERDAERFRRLVAEEWVVLFVVGLPLHLDERESPKSLEARAFGRWLSETTGVPVEFFDERFTSHEAEEILQSANLTQKRRKKRLDMLAAQIILRGFLEERGEGREERGEGREHQGPGAVAG
jgi:putative Holliday junction resolvase